LIENYVENSRERNTLQAGMTVQEAERLLIMKTLEHTLQNRTQAAHLLGISIRTLRNKLNEYKLEVHDEQRLV
jgi:DNA-binding NtrC family response regulator